MSKKLERERERALRSDEQRSGPDVSPAQGGSLGDGLVYGPAAGRRPRYLSACSGVGGFDLAADRLGWECVGQIEIADFPTRVLERRFPGVPRHRDLRTYRGERGGADVLMGGTPCQDWSVAGKRAGLAGERSGLFFDFARIADEVAPGLVVFENVPGLLSACSCPECAQGRADDADDEEAVALRVTRGHRGSDFAIVLDELTGFWPEPPRDGWRTAGVCSGPKRTAVWRVLDSRYAGVAQRRRRVFVVASPRADSALALLADAIGREGDSAAGGEARADVAGTLEGGAAGARGWRVGADEAGGISKSLRSGRRGADDPDRTTYIPEVGVTLSANTGRNHIEQDYIPQVGRALTGTMGKRHDDTDTVVAHTLRASGFDASEDGTGRGTPIVAAPITNGVGGRAGRRREDDVNLAIGFNAGGGGDKGLSIVRDGVPPVTASNGDPGAVVYGISANALRTGEAKTLSPDATGKVRLRDPAAVPVYEDESPTLDASGRHMVGPVESVALRGRDGGATAELGGDLSHALRSPQGGGDKAHVLTASVRRLTPTETERLQAFPDGWSCLEVDDDGTGTFRFSDGEPYSTERCTCADGNRYAAMGNAVTVSQVVRVLGVLGAAQPVTVKPQDQVGYSCEPCHLAMQRNT